MKFIYAGRERERERERERISRVDPVEITKCFAFLLGDVFPANFERERERGSRELGKLYYLLGNLIPGKR